MIRRHVAAAAVVLLLVGAGADPAVAEPPTDVRPAARATGARTPTAPVRDVQRLLDELGFDPGPVDGILGPRTAGAIRAFQREVGLAADGYPSPRLLVELEAQKAARRPRATDAADQSALIEAIVGGDVERVGRLLLDGRVDVTAVRMVGGSRWSVLRQAVVQPEPSPAIVMMLLDAGARDDPGTPCDQQSLISAIVHARETVVRTLLAAGLDPNACNALAQAIAVWADKPQMVPVLLAAGADPDQPATAWSGPPLLQARSPALVKALVDAGADVNRQHSGSAGILAKHVLNCATVGDDAAANVALLLDAGAEVTPQVQTLAFGVRDGGPGCAKVYDLISSR